MKRKINCLVCTATYMNNNSNDPYDAIYLGFLEGQKRATNKPAFIHTTKSCIKKARKLKALDSGGKFENCIVCGHRVNLSLKNLEGGGTIKQNGYLVDTKVWIHTPFPLKDKHNDLIISDCYEKAFGHSNFPPDDILSKRAEIIEKYVKKNKVSNLEDNKESLEKKAAHQSKKSNLDWSESVVGNDTSTIQRFYAEKNKKPGQQFMPQDLFELIVAGVGYLYFYSNKKESIEGLTKQMLKEYESMIINDDLENDIIITTNEIIDFLKIMKTPEDMMAGFFKRFQELIENYNPDGTKKNFLKKKVFGGLWFNKSQINTNRINDCVKRAKSFYVIMKVL